MSRYNIISTLFLVLFIVSLMVDGTYDIHFSWYVALVAVYIIINGIGASMLSLQYFVPVKFKGQQNQSVALTFDDGPVAGKTEKVLDVLKEYNIKASFFCIGKKVEQHPDLLRRIDAEGHLIGNHSYHHGYTFDLQSSSMITKELADTDTVIASVINKKPRFFRPPYGVTNLNAEIVL
jgi:peptidoglycan-N-acetylglucosamine deacetylase